MTNLENTLLYVSQRPFFSYETRRREQTTLAVSCTLDKKVDIVKTKMGYFINRGSFI